MDSRFSKLRTLDLFCGCGGLTEGLSQAEWAGHRPFVAAGAMDLWSAACDAFSKNHAIEATCEAVSAESVTRLLDAVGDVDLVVGGPPCQGFSTSGKRAFDDPRNSLMRAYFEAVEIAKPCAFLMENVSGFTTFQGGQIMAEVIGRARELGFKTYPGVVLASLAGVPQRRRRFILVGLREGRFGFPGDGPLPGDATQDPMFEDVAETGASALIVNQRVGSGPESWTFDDATSDLPELAAGEESTRYASDPQNDFQERMREQAPARLADHVASNHRDYFVRMMSYVPPGRSAVDPEIQALMPEELRPKSGFPNSYARIVGSQPSPTITRNFTTPSSANCIHPRSHRSLTLREGARCQSFPDRYEFAGTHGDRRLMIGNSVPPLLAKALGERLLLALQEGRLMGTAAASEVHGQA